MPSPKGKYGAHVIAKSPFLGRPSDESISEEEERVVTEARDWLKRQGGKVFRIRRRSGGWDWSDGDRMDRFHRLVKSLCGFSSRGLLLRYPRTTLPW
jgi:hypothetical protein